MSANTVHVENISSETSDKEVKDFFSFCGKITDISVEPSADGKTKTATVTFEKETAAKTALLLHNTQLGLQQISVKSATGSSELDDGGAHYTANADRDTDEITQEEKPRSRILAEYLAHGYLVGDTALERAIELDHKHGVSARFLSTLQGLDKKYHATDRAKTVDSSYGFSSKANNILGSLSSYFEKASNTPTGQKIVNFYTASSKQVHDVHAEARRLAELKKQEHGGSAYKAAGLEKVFGKEKPKEEAAAPPAAAGEPAAAAPPAPATDKV